MSAKPSGIPLNYGITNHNLIDFIIVILLTPISFLLTIYNPLQLYYQAALICSSWDIVTGYDPKL